MGCLAMRGKPLDRARDRVHIADMAKRRSERGKADARKGAETPSDGRSEGEGLTDEQIHERRQSDSQRAVRAQSGTGRKEALT